MTLKLCTVAASLILLVQPMFSQKVKLAKISLGMTEAEVKEALAPSTPHYIDQTSTPKLRSLVAETAEESFAFTFIEGHVAAYSLMHVLPAGQQPFLAPGQEPTVKVLRDLVIGQTWKPASVDKGDTSWFSDAAGSPLLDATTCMPQSSQAWQPLGTVKGATMKTTEGLMRPSLVKYPANCGVTIHLHEAPAANDNDRVSAVQIQVLDTRVLNQFLAKQ